MGVRDSTVGGALYCIIQAGGKDPACQYGDIRHSSSIPGFGRSPGVGNGNPLQYSCLGNPMDRGFRWATVHGVTKSWTRLKRLSTHTSKLEFWSSEFPSISSSHLALVLYSQESDWPWFLVPGKESKFLEFPM